MESSFKATVKWEVIPYSAVRHLSLEASFSLSFLLKKEKSRVQWEEHQTTDLGTDSEPRFVTWLSCVTQEKPYACSVLEKRTDPLLSKVCPDPVALWFSDFLSCGHLGTWPLYLFSFNSKPAHQLWEGEAVLVAMPLTWNQECSRQRATYGRSVSGHLTLQVTCDGIGGCGKGPGPGETLGVQPRARTWLRRPDSRPVLHYCRAHV